MRSISISLKHLELSNFDCEPSMSHSGYMYSQLKYPLLNLKTKLLNEYICKKLSRNMN